MLRIIAVVSVVGLAACVPAAMPVTPPAMCDTVALAAFVGAPLASLQAAGLPPGTRIIRPGDAITEDYSESRLNVDLDARDNITRLWCG